MTQNSDFYDEQTHAQAYTHRNYQETYYLIERCLKEYFQTWTPAAIKHAKAIDYGCGTGSSTRLLKDFGFDVVGIDPSLSMIEVAKKIELAGDYVHINDFFNWQDLENCFDLVSSSFVLPVLCTEKEVHNYLLQSRRLLKDNGIFLIVTAGWEAFDPAYSWLSWHQDFPENNHLRNGGAVKGYLRQAQLLLEDTLWTRDFLKDAMAQNHLRIESLFQPLGYPTDPFSWLSEKTTSPFEIYILRKDI